MKKNKFSGFFAKKYTFIFIPDLTGKLKRYSLPKNLIIGALGFFMISVVAFSVLAFNIFQKSAGLSELDELRSSTINQKLEIQQFSKKLNQMEAQLARLEKFDRKLRVITALEKQTPATVELGTGGPSNDSIKDFSSASKKYTQSLMGTLDSDLERIKSQAEAQEVSFFELDEFFKEQSSLLSHTPSIWPVRGWVTSTFGYRRSPFTGLREMHEGMDVATQLKAPVIAPANGIVVRVGYDRGYGNLVEIDHGYGVVSRFGHNSKNLVKVGQRVKRGDMIALVGSTGRSTGPHLHYEVLLNGVPVNPYRYILEE